MKLKTLLPILALVILMAIPSVVSARMVHDFACNLCHKPGANLDMVASNLCIDCHRPGRTGDKFSLLKGTGDTNTIGLNTFITSDASDAMGSRSAQIVIAGQPGISHNWAAPDSKDKAGASFPVDPRFYGRYNYTGAKVACARCHDPHGVDTDDGRSSANPKLLKLGAGAADEMCLDCHRGWKQNEASDGLETHPIVQDYNTVATAANEAASLAGEPQDRYKLAVGKAVDNFGGNGDVQLVDAVDQGMPGTYGVSCTSCHGVHHTDSDSDTIDGTSDIPGLSLGDGFMLRSDGPGSTNKSALCQACHNYTEHGDSGGANSSVLAAENGGMPIMPIGTKVGCLECHGGHSYNNNNPQYYVLRDQIGAPYNVTLNASYDYDSKPTDHQQVSPWNDGVDGVANGYCEKCHGDAAAITGSQHDKSAQCMNCHYHNDADYSFKPGANVAVCGDCHGFPPTLNIQGDRKSNGLFEGGYAYISASNNYSAATNSKDESTTPHGTHAAAGVTFASDHPNVPSQDQPVGLDTDYRMGDGESACSACHGARASHDTDPTGVGIGTYQDLDFDSRAGVDGQTAPSYAAGGRETCSNIYCHSNGGARNGDNPTESTRVWSFIETPYNATSSSGWDLAKDELISPAFGDATECATCHGNNVASMASRGNSAAHAIHIGTKYNYTCNVCHADTATSNITVPKEARDISKNSGDPTLGTHVNDKVDVVFDATFNGGMISLATYDAALGTCAVACHAASTPDWDIAGPLDCDSCHGGLPNDTTPINSGSHSIHIDSTKADIACFTCHGGSVDDGTHSGHVDGLTTYATPSAGFADVCNECHGVEQLEDTPSAGLWQPLNPWDTDPVWTNNTSEDCRTCHTGNETTTYTRVSSGAITAPDKSTALTVGHNSASGDYGLPRNNAAANQNCQTCHLEVVAGTSHIDGAVDSGDRLVANFACENCHTTDGGGGLADWIPALGRQAKVVMTHNNAAYPGATQAPSFSKLCQACHDPHGSSNKFMVFDNRIEQNNEDPDGTTDQFQGDVVLTFDDGTFANANSFDETDTANADDVCATCHDTTLHNKQPYTVATHAGGAKTGSNCLDCHAHDNPEGGFMPSGGDSCNGCHGNPPDSGAHLAHAWVGTHELTEDRTDCAYCHTGADSYTFNPSTDQGNSLNHSNDPGRVTILNTNPNVTFQNVSGNVWNCASACHATSASDGYWRDTTTGDGPLDWARDTDGLDCGACHGEVGTGKPADTSHVAHVDTASKACTLCHPAVSGGTWPLGHIITASYPGPADDGAALVNRATASAGEATLDFTGGATEYNYTAPSCSVPTNNGMGCHATGEPAWDTPASGNTCVACHSDNVGAANPTSGLHDVTPLVSEVKHDFSVTGGCEACHTNVLAKSTHADGTFTGGNNQLLQMGLDATGSDFYTQAADNEGTCATTNCHLGYPGGSDDWDHVWTDAPDYYIDKNSSCDGCHGTTNSGFNAGTVHKNTPGMRAKHGVTTTDYTCKDCHNLEAGSGYTFTFDTADWNPAPGDSSTHGDEFIQINSETTYDDGASGYCQACHISGVYNFTATGWTVLEPVGDEIITACGECHLGGASAAAATESHTKHGIDFATDLVDNGPKCTPCHTAPLTLGFQNDLAETHGDGNVTLDTGRISDYNGGLGLVKWDGIESTCTNSCHLTAGGEVWDKQGPFETLACDSCHYYAGSPNSASNTGGTAVQDAHNTHFTAPGISNCNQCHTVDTDDKNAPFGHIQGVGILQRSSGMFAAAGIADLTPLGADWTSGADTCNNAACHNPTPGASKVSPAWDAATVDDCTMCHDLPPTDPSGGSHAAHLTGGFGRTIACVDCHVDNSGDYDHLGGTGNASVDVQVRPTPGASFTTVVSPKIAGGCGTNECHWSGDSSSPAPEVANYTWGTEFGNCVGCHVNGTGGLSTAHDAHILNTAFVSGSCADCHTAGTHANHLDGNVDFDTAAAMNTPADNSAFDGSCTNSCHIAADAGDWDNGYGALACADCHENGLNVGWPPATGAHVKHLVGSTYIPTANCVDCHTNNAADHSDLDTFVTPVTDGSKISAWEPAAVTESCTNSCHLANVAGDWTGGPTVMACTDCHASGSGYVGDNSGTYLATSGLHATTAPNVTPHDENIPGGAGCESCHTAYNSEPSSHMDGTWLADGPSNEGGAQPRFVNRTDMTYGELAVNNSTCSGTGLAGACHTDNGEWSRLWSTEADFDYVASPNPGQNVCNVCHGQYSALNAKGWRAGTSHFKSGVGALEDKGLSHISADLTADKCERCHGYDTVAAHDSGTIDFSGNGSTAGGNFNVAAGATGVYCNSCHFSQRDEPATTTTTHTFPTSTAFTGAKNYAGGALLPEGGCTSCHGSGDGGYWPDDSPGGGADDDDAHTVHMTALAQQVWGENLTDLKLDTGTSSDDKQKALCEYCHAAVSNDDDHMTAGQADVFDVLMPGPTRFAKKLWDGSADTGASFNTSTKTCSNVACHNGKATDVATDYSWITANTSDCDMCHNALDNTHNDHTSAQTNNFGISIACTDCHGDGITASTVPSNNHIDGIFQIGNTATNSGVAFGYTGSYTDVATKTLGSCATNACHEDGTGNTPAVDPYNWGTTQADCTLCHDQTSGRHADHPESSALIAADCLDCHTAALDPTHINDSLQVGGTSGLTYGNPGCTNNCHLINGDSATYGDWLDAQPLDCVDCHNDSATYIGGGANMPATGLHATDTALAHNHNFDGDKDCTDCHTTVPTTTHLDNTLDAIDGSGTDANWNWDAQLTQYTYYGAGDTRCSASCHDDGGDWLRRWEGVVNAKPQASDDPAVATVCGNCHGSFNMLWNGMSTSHTNPYDQGGPNSDTMSSHSECAKCHGWGSTDNPAGYDENWAGGVHNVVTPSHGDGYISMNGPSPTVGAQYDDGTGGCADACHGSGYVMNSNSGFLVDYEDFGSGGCNLCHGGDNNTVQAENYWPDGDQAETTPDRSGAHLKHVSAAADYMDNTMDGSYTESNANSACAYCHPGYPSPENVGLQNYDGVAHNTNTNGSLADTADLHKDGYNPDTNFTRINKGADTDGYYNPGTQQCSLIDCHGGAATTPGWYSVPGVATQPPLTYNVTVDGFNYTTITQGDPVTLAAIISDTSDGMNNVTGAKYMIDAIPSGGAGTDMDNIDAPAVQVNTSSVISGATTSGWSAGEHAVYVYGFDTTDDWGPVGHATVNVITADSVTVSSTDLAVVPPTKIVKSTLTPMLRLDITTPMNESTLISAVTVDLTTGIIADVERCYIYLDNGDGLFSTVNDIAIGEALVDNLSITVPIATTKADNFGTILYVAYLVSSGAGNDSYFAAQVTGMTIDTEDSIVAGLPATSSDSQVKPPDLGDATSSFIYPSGTATGHNIIWTAGNWATALDSADATVATAINIAQMNLAMDSTGLGVTSEVSKVVLSAVVSRASSSLDEGLDIGLADTGAGTTFYSGTNGFDVGDPLTTPMTEEFTTNPETGSAWTVTEVNAIRPAILTGNFNKGFQEELYVDQVSVEVFYAPALPEATTPPLTYSVKANGTGPEITLSKGAALTLSAIVDDAGGGGDSPTAEYFLDSDPGEGNATPMAITFGGGTATITFDDNATINTNDAAWTVGRHFLYVRGLDSDGWGGPTAVVVNITDGDGVSVIFANKAPVVAELGIRYPMLNLKFNLDGAGDTEGEITQITVDMTTTGTAHGDDASLISIFDDSGSDFGNWDSNDSLVGQTVFPSATAPTSVLIDIDNQKIDATGKTLFVIAGISPSGTAGNSFAVAVDAANIALTEPDTMLTVGIGSSNEMTLELSAITCGECHKIPAESGAHLLHANGDTDPGDCIRCHGDNAPYGFSTHPRGYHNDGVSADLQGLIDNGGGGYSGGLDGTCATDACHYGNDSPPWMNGATDCSYCHGNGYLSDKPWPIASSHTNHISSFGFANLTDAQAPAVCDACHLGAGGGSPNHGNGNYYDVVIDPMFNDKSPGAPSYTGGATGTCANVSCHGGQTTPAWDNLSATNSININLTSGATQTAECSKCHDFGGTEYNGFQSGKHQIHIFSGNSNCDDCHDAQPAGHFLLANLQTAPMVNPSDVGPGAGSYSDSTTVMANGMFFDATGDSGTCSNTGTGCHGGNSNTVWNPTTAGDCDFCHGYPPVAGGLHASGAFEVDHNAFGNGVLVADPLRSNHDDCTVCHGTKALSNDPGTKLHAPETGYSVSSDHRDGNIEINVDPGYNNTNFGCDSAACHITGPNDVAHRLSDSGFAVEAGNYGVGSCTSCHAAGSGGAPVVDSASPHTSWNGGSFIACEECHSGHAPEGAPGAGEIKISTITGRNVVAGMGNDTGTLRPTLNNQYASHDSWILLGGTHASGNTEAELCWGCHAAQTPDISEWDGASASYDYGSVTPDDLNWTTTSWTSAIFNYKNGKLSNKPRVSDSVTGEVNGGSTHGTALTDTTVNDGVNAVSEIGCTLCHDVHDTGGGVNDANGPYLRGTWLSNPYPEDGAPQTTAHATVQGGVPRAGLGSSWNTAPNAIGGWQIEQNNNVFDEAGEDYSTFGGLCNTCHSETSLETAWLSHKFVVDGFNGGAENSTNNIFSTTKRGGNGVAQGRGFMQHNSTTGHSGDWMYGLRTADGETGKAPYQGFINNQISSTRPMGPVVANGWGISVDPDTVDQGFHQFLCSKCHNPHASRLPRLLITNCLDVQLNAWDDTLEDPSGTELGTSFGAGGHTSKQLAYASTAANCHRYVSGSDSNRETYGGAEDGWNNVTPWNP